MNVLSLVYCIFVRQCGLLERTHPTGTETGVSENSELTEATKTEKNISATESSDSDDYHV